MPPRCIEDNPPSHIIRPKYHHHLYPQENIHAYGRRNNIQPSPLSGGALDEAGTHFSATERRADEASRSVTTWLKCHYMQQHLGEEFVGIISATAEFGLFVTLKDLYVDGMVHVSQLGDDFFVFDQVSQNLVGQNRGQVFGLGDEVKIKVAGVNLEERKIDFELVQQLSHAGRAIRARAPRVSEKKPAVRPAATEEVFSKNERESKSSLNADGEQPIRRKKAKGKPSSYNSKPPTCSTT